jgi:hypothetical protein
MKPLPAPQFPARTKYERFENAVRQILSVSKEDLLKMEAQDRRQKGMQEGKETR